MSAASVTLPGERRPQRETRFHSELLETCTPKGAGAPDGFTFYALGISSPVLPCPHGLARRWRQRGRSSWQRPGLMLQADAAPDGWWHRGALWLAAQITLSGTSPRPSPVTNQHFCWRTVESHLLWQALPEDPSHSAVKHPAAAFFPRLLFPGETQGKLRCAACKACL